LPSSYAAPVDALAFDENAMGDDAVSDPAVWTALRFRDALVAAGIRISGTVRVRRDRQANAATPPPGERVAVIESPMVAQLLMSVLKNSQNLYAETLFKRSSPSGSYDESEQLERMFATTEARVSADELRTVDGCGLAPDDLVTPAAIVQILRWMNAPVRRGTWWMILAQPGAEGTLRNRLKNLTDRLRGKTGTINGVAALSGIVVGEKGGYRYFSIIINHNIGSSGDAVRTIDQIAQEIAKF
jgi:D-alanyl-D-alanine carboxypeptidase/D-alanyl-D-alanine-endopeptidase (penicillin-binding protein 4)